MSSVQLPRGAERSYYGGVQTRLPLTYAILIIVSCLLSPLSVLPIVFDDAPVLPMLITNGVLSAIAIGLFIPAIRLSRQGVLNAEHCRKHSLRLRVHAVLCTILAAAFMVTYGLLAPFAPLFIGLTALSCFLAASHLRRIWLSLRAEEREAEAS